VPDVGVVHLVRKANGLAPIARFLRSYVDHGAGLPHDLVVVFKGFPANPGEEFEELLARVPHQRIFVPDRGYDLGAYFAVMAGLPHRYFCFLNSFSRILADDWLQKLHRAASIDGAGPVAATGSYQSSASLHAERARMLARLPLAEQVRWRFNHVASDPSPWVGAQRAAAWLLGGVGLWNPARHFPPFPNYHLRTNAFMASRDVLGRIRAGWMPFKLSTFLFESGTNSLTRQALALGRRPLLVTRSGEALDKEDWHLADCFRQGRQGQLLVADNQTDLYENAAPADRAELSRLAWGRFARPA
jgi:hypothetical protein